VIAHVHCYVCSHRLNLFVVVVFGFIVYNQNMELYQFSPSTAGLNDVSRAAEIELSFGILDDAYDSIDEGSVSFPKEVIRIRNLLRQFGTLTISDLRFSLSPTPCPAGEKVLE